MSIFVFYRMPSQARQRRPSAKRAALGKTSPKRKSPLPIRQLVLQRKKHARNDEWDLDTAVAFVEGKGVDDQPRRCGQQAAQGL